MNKLIEIQRDSNSQKTFRWPIPGQYIPGMPFPLRFYNTICAIYAQSIVCSESLSFLRNRHAAANFRTISNIRKMSGNLPDFGKQFYIEQTSFRITFFCIQAFQVIRFLIITKMTNLLFQCRGTCQLFSGNPLQKIQCTARLIG